MGQLLTLPVRRMLAVGFPILRNRTEAFDTREVQETLAPPEGAIVPPESLVQALAPEVPIEVIEHPVGAGTAANNSLQPPLTKSLGGISGVL